MYLFNHSKFTKINMAYKIIKSYELFYFFQ